MGANASRLNYKMCSTPEGIGGGIRPPGKLGESSTENSVRFKDPSESGGPCQARWLRGERFRRGFAYMDLLGCQRTFLPSVLVVLAALSEVSRAGA